MVDHSCHLCISASFAPQPEQRHHPKRSPETDHSRSFPRENPVRQYVAAPKAQHSTTLHWPQPVKAMQTKYLSPQEALQTQWWTEP